MTLIENLRAVDPWSEHDCYMSAPLFTRAADRIEKLEAALRWYADQMCEGWCQGKDPKACANIGADNCAGCPAVAVLAS